MNYPIHLPNTNMLLEMRTQDHHNMPQNKLPPPVPRYRKEMTGDMSTEKLYKIKEQVNRLENLSMLIILRIILNFQSSELSEHNFSFHTLQMPLFNN